MPAQRKYTFKRTCSTHNISTEWCDCKAACLNIALCNEAAMTKGAHFKWQSHTQPYWCSFSVKSVPLCTIVYSFSYVTATNLDFTSIPDNFTSTSEQCYSSFSNDHLCFYHQLCLRLPTVKTLKLQQFNNRLNVI